MKQNLNYKNAINNVWDTNKVRPTFSGFRKEEDILEGKSN